MQVSVETGEGLERRLTIELPYEQIASEVDKRLQEMSRNARLPGFRPGKVPIQVLRKRYGEAVRREIFGEMVESSFPEAVAQTSLRPAGMPRIEPSIDLAEQRIGYTAVFEILPEFEIVSLADRVLKSPISEITEADVETMIETLRRQRANWVVTEQPAELGDRLTINFTGTLEGEPFEGGSGQEVILELGSGRMIPGFEAGLVGAETGSQRTLELVFPESYHVEHLAGKPVRFEVTVGQVERSELPEVDADFLAIYGVEDGDQARFRADVRANMEREMRRRLESRRKQAVMDLLLEAHEVEIPGVLVESEKRAMADQMRETLGQAKLDLPLEMFAEPARRRVSLGLIVGEIVKQQGLQADPDRVRAVVAENAASYEHPEAVLEYFLKDPQTMASIEGLVLEEQVVSWVLEQVQLEESAITFAQLTENESPS
ncbi:trigger factor [Thiocapsa imhoffii]|uniref:Trigger factor n=1 Tax=Thiocapsa imhoffii TaxID=382777 RepID=A0A9X0WKJ5_9GAMM|nr:trigger factor [Thiocapsa imhoffii]MBK1646243.1 trigger factor [Thiocapsa imhoffii]